MVLNSVMHGALNNRICLRKQTIFKNGSEDENVEIPEFLRRQRGSETKRPSELPKGRRNARMAIEINNSQHIPAEIVFAGIFFAPISWNSK